MPQLVQLNAQGQKIYPSIEVTSNFGGSGKVYLTGLAVTDMPAVIGTQPLKFSYGNAEYTPDRTTPVEDVFWTFSAAPPKIDTSFQQIFKDFFSGHSTKQDQQQRAFAAELSDIKQCLLILGAGIDQRFNALHPNLLPQPAPLQTSTPTVDLALLGHLEQLLQKQNIGFSVNAEADVNQRLQQVFNAVKQLEQTPQTTLPPSGQTDTQLASF